MSSAILKPLPRWADVVLLPILNLALAFIVSGLVVLAIGQDPLSALNAIVTGAFGNGYNFGYTLYYSTNFMFTGLAGYSLFCKLFTSLAVPGWTSNVLIASFFGAVNSLGISMLGEYVIRIYDQVRGRPMFVVARTTGTMAPGPHERTGSQNQLATSIEAAEQLLADAHDLLDTLAGGRRATDPVLK